MGDCPVLELTRDLVADRTGAGVAAFTRTCAGWYRGLDLTASEVGVTTERLVDLDTFTLSSVRRPAAPSLASARRMQAFQRLRIHGLLRAGVGDRPVADRTALRLVSLRPMCVGEAGGGLGAAGSRR